MLVRPLVPEVCVARLLSLRANERWRGLEGLPPCEAGDLGAKGGVVPPLDEERPEALPEGLGLSAIQMYGFSSSIVQR